MATCLEKLKVTGNLTDVREMSGKHLVRKNSLCRLHVWGYFSRLLHASLCRAVLRILLLKIIRPTVHKQRSVFRAVLLFMATQGRPLYFCPLVCIFMAALRNRCGHYILHLWFLSSSFFPSLISAVADWMSNILLHMVWP